MLKTGCHFDFIAKQKFRRFQKGKIDQTYLGVFQI